MCSLVFSELEITEQTVIIADSSKPSGTISKGNIRLQIKKEKKKKPTPTSEQSQKLILTHQEA